MGNIMRYEAVVKLDPEIEPGIGEFSNYGLSKDKLYRTRALTIITSPDNSSSLCFVLLNDNKKLVRKATRLFKVVKELP